MSQNETPSDQPKRKRKGGTPPKEHQWPKGVSGNPGGRPKKTPTLRDAVYQKLAGSASHPHTGEPVALMTLVAEVLIRGALQKPKDAIQVARWLEGAHPPMALEDGDPEDSAIGDEAIVAAALQRLLRREQLSKSRKPKTDAEED